MATEFVYLKGKAKWPKLVVPDAKFGDPKWSVVLYPDDESYNIVLDLKKRGIKNMVKKDEDGYYTTFSRPQQKVYRGKVQGFAPPIVLGPDNLPWTEGTLIGNGSDVTIKLEVFSFRTPGDGPGKMTGCAARLASVRIDNLVPYTPQRDMDEDQKNLARGLEEQPAQALF